jgi:hypothetical protein
MEPPSYDEKGRIWPPEPELVHVRDRERRAGPGREKKARNGLTESLDEAS